MDVLSIVSAARVFAEHIIKKDGWNKGKNVSKEKLREYYTNTYKPKHKTTNPKKALPSFAVTFWAMKTKGYIQCVDDKKDTTVFTIKLNKETNKQPKETKDTKTKQRKTHGKKSEEDGKGTETTSPNKTPVQRSEKKIDCKAPSKEKQNNFKQKDSKQQLSLSSSKTDIQKSMPTKPVTKKNGNIVSKEQCKVKKVVQLKENVKPSESCHHEKQQSKRSIGYKEKISEEHQDTKENECTTSVQNNKDKMLYSAVVNSSKCVEKKDPKDAALKENMMSWRESLSLPTPRRRIYRGKSFVHQGDTAKHFCAVIRGHPHEGWMKRGTVPKMLLREYYTDTYKPNYNKANPGHTIFQFCHIYHTMRMLNLVKEYEDDSKVTMAKFTNKKQSTENTTEKLTKKSKKINKSSFQKPADDSMTTECTQERKEDQGQTKNPVCNTQNKDSSSAQADNQSEVQPSSSSKNDLNLSGVAKFPGEENKCVFLSPSHTGEKTTKDPKEENGLESPSEGVESCMPNTIITGSQEIARTSEENALSNESVAQHIDLFKWSDERNQFEFLNPSEKVRLDNKVIVETSSNIRDLKSQREEDTSCITFGNNKEGYSTHCNQKASLNLGKAIESNIGPYFDTKNLLKWPNDNNHFEFLNPSTLSERQEDLVNSDVWELLETLGIGFQEELLRIPSLKDLELVLNALEGKLADLISNVGLRGDDEAIPTLTFDLVPSPNDIKGEQAGTETKYKTEHIEVNTKTDASPNNAPTLQDKQEWQASIDSERLANGKGKTVEQAETIKTTNAKTLTKSQKKRLRKQRKKQNQITTAKEDQGVKEKQNDTLLQDTEKAEVPVTECKKVTLTDHASENTIAAQDKTPKVESETTDSKTSVAENKENFGTEQINSNATEKVNPKDHANENNIAAQDKGSDVESKTIDIKTLVAENKEKRVEQIHSNETEKVTRKDHATENTTAALDKTSDIESKTIDIRTRVAENKEKSVEQTDSKENGCANKLTKSERKRLSKPKKKQNQSTHTNQILKQGDHHINIVQFSGSHIQVIPFSSRTIKIEWNKVQGYSKYQVCIENTTKGLLRNYITLENHILIQEDLSPGNNYIIIVKPKGSDLFGMQFYRAVLLRWEIQELLSRALNFMLAANDRKTPIHYMYRNKPTPYFEDILRNRNYIMEKYKKDFNGDNGSPINGTIDGLFFNVWLDRKGQPPSQSPFGEFRIFLPLRGMITNTHNVYFSDFYCHYNQHYITLVVTEKGSFEDTFCKNHLLLLGLLPETNPFFFFDPLKNSFFCSSRLKVEILYAQDIDLRYVFAGIHDCFFTIVEPIGRGSSRPEGIPKNPRCKVCNIYEYNSKF